MTPLELEFLQKGREMERVAVVAFLRRFTNLRALATLIADRAHFELSEKDLRAYAKARQIGDLR